MSSLPIEMVPHSRDDLRSDFSDAHGATAAEMIAAIDAAVWLMPHGSPLTIRGLFAARDFILSQSAADLPPADRATAKPSAASVRATSDGGA